MAGQRQLLFAHLPVSHFTALHYYDEYMKVLNSHYNVTWYPHCRIQLIEAELIRREFGPDDIVFFNQHCVNQHKDVSKASSVMRNVKCRIAFMNKEYQSLDEKLDFIKHKLKSTLVLTHHHAVAEMKAKLGGLYVARIPFAASQEFSTYADTPETEFRYLRDVGHSGNSIYYENGSSDPRAMSWRQVFHNMSASGAFSAAGVNASVLPYAKNQVAYIRNMAESKMWFSTLSQGQLIPQRTFEVMATGRAALFMNRPNDTRITAGIVTEGQDCIMFDSAKEMMSKAVYYATHEAERRKIVANALKRARESHFWKSRADMIRFIIDNMNCGI